VRCSCVDGGAEIFFASGRKVTYSYAIATRIPKNYASQERNQGGLRGLKLLPLSQVKVEKKDKKI